MSMRDLGLLAQRLLTDFPEYYPMFAETEFLFDATESANRFNRNPLLRLDIGADGLKTGHTQEAGFGLTGSAKQGDRRVVFVLSGMDTAAARAEESEAVVNWAFRQFAQRTLATSGQRLALADVWEGAEPQVGIGSSPRCQRPASRSCGPHCIRRSGLYRSRAGPDCGGHPAGRTCAATRRTARTTALHWWPKPMWHMAVFWPACRPQPCP